MMRMLRERFSYCSPPKVDQGWFCRVEKSSIIQGRETCTFHYLPKSYRWMSSSLEPCSCPKMCTWHQVFHQTFRVCVGHSCIIIHKISFTIERGLTLKIERKRERICVSKFRNRFPSPSIRILSTYAFSSPSSDMVWCCLLRSDDVWLPNFANIQSQILRTLFFSSRTLS